MKTSRGIKKKQYTLSEAMEIISTMRDEIGVKEIHEREIKLAEERGYERAMRDIRRDFEKRSALLMAINTTNLNQ